MDVKVIEANKVNLIKAQEFTIDAAEIFNIDTTGQDRLFLVVDVTGTAQITVFESLPDSTAEVAVSDEVGTTVFNVTDDQLVLQVDLFGRQLIVKATPTGTPTLKFTGAMKGGIQ